MGCLYCDQTCDLCILVVIVDLGDAELDQEQLIGSLAVPSAGSQQSQVDTHALPYTKMAAT
jgi:hypothetical protein